MDLSGPAGAGVSAGIVATVGTWWFAMVLKGLKQLPQTTRWGVYALIWLAYFILTTILMRQLGAV